MQPVKIAATAMAAVLVGMSVLRFGPDPAAAAPLPPVPATDPAVDWLLSHATTAPTTGPAEAIAPATQPAFAPPASLAAARNGTVLLSNGTRITGRIATTPDKPIRLWDEADQQYQDLPFALIQSIEASVVWERMEPEWRFAASGSDVKVFSGRTYPARLTRYRITLASGAVFDGGVVAPLIVTADGKTHTYVLHKRDKGETGQTLAQLVYVTRVTFDP